MSQRGNYKPVFCKKTPDSVTALKDNEVFVFGSNIAGIHGKGAAKTATQWGAVKGKGIGLYGQTYALPTKRVWFDKHPLPIRSIDMYVRDLANAVRLHKNKHFIITEVGCGLAGYAPEDIAPLFHEFVLFENCSLPKRFIDVLCKNN